MVSGDSVCLEIMRGGGGIFDKNKFRFFFVK